MSEEQATDDGSFVDEASNESFASNEAEGGLFQSPESIQVDDISVEEIIPELPAPNSKAIEITSISEEERILTIKHQNLRMIYEHDFSYNTEATEVQMWKAAPPGTLSQEPRLRSEPFLPRRQVQVIR